MSATWKQWSAGVYLLTFAEGSTQTARHKFMDDVYTQVAYQTPLFNDVTMSASVGYYDAKFALPVKGTQLDYSLTLKKNNFSLTTTFKNKTDADPITFLSYAVAAF